MNLISKYAIEQEKLMPMRMLPSMPQVEEKENIEEDLEHMILNLDKGNIHKNYFVQNNVEIKKTIGRITDQI